MADINALLSAGVGPSLVEGAHAGYFAGRGRLEQQQEQQRQAAQPDIPAALGGDTAAQARVFAGDPKTGALVIAKIAQMDADKQAHVKAVANWTAQAANSVLQADPKDQPAMYQRALEEGRSLGYDVSRLPQAWDNSVPAILRYHRASAIPIVEQFKQQEETKRKQMPGGVNRAGGEVDMPESGKQSSAAPPAAPVTTADAGLPPGVQTPPYLAPSTAAAASPPILPGTAAGGTTATLASQASPAEPPPMAPAGPPEGFQAMGHRDPQGNLVPALIDGKPVYRNPQTGEMQLGPTVAQAAPAGPVPDQGSGGTNAQGPDGGLPGPQVAQAAPPSAAPALKNGQIVFDDPALQGGKIRGRIMPNGEFKPTEGAGNTVKYRMPDGTEVYYNPTHKRPQSSDIGITPANENLHGDEFIATLPAGDRNIVKGLMDGTLLIQDLSKRAQDYNRYLALAKQADPDFDPTPGGARRRFEQQFMTSGQGGQTVLATNTASDHMKTYHDLMSALGNGNTQMLNTALNAVRRQFGDAAATNPEAARAVLATEIAKAVRGAGAINEQEEKQYTSILSSSQSPAQTQGTLATLTNLMMGRVHAIEDRAKAVGVPDSRVNEYLSPRAREALDYIQKNPVGGGKEAPGILDQIGSMFKTSPPGGAQIPTMTPDQVRAAPSGTRYKTIDGREGVRP